MKIKRYKINFLEYVAMAVMFVISLFPFFMSKDVLDKHLLLKEFSDFMAALVPSIDRFAQISQIPQIVKLQMSILWVGMIVIVIIFFFAIGIKFLYAFYPEYLKKYIEKIEVSSYKKDSLEKLRECSLKMFLAYIFAVLFILSEWDIIHFMSFYYGDGYVDDTWGKFKFVGMLQTPLGVSFVSFSWGLGLPAIHIVIFFSFFKWLFCLKERVANRRL